MLLKSFRTRYNLTQISAARWCLIPAGTYRDYEQARSKPPRIIDYALRNRLIDYDVAYEKYIREREERKAASEAAAKEFAIASS